MGLSNRAKNILTVLIALVLVGGFVFLAEGQKSKDKDDRLEAIENLTTTTQRRTTTTRRPTTTSSTVLSTTSSSAPAATTATTLARTTTTRRASTTATTRRPATTTTVAPGPTGLSRESSSNESTIVHNSDGSFATASSDAGPTRPFGFTVSSCVIPSAGSNCVTSGGGASGDTMQVRFTVTVKNNTGRTISFGADGLTIDVTLTRPDGTVSQFVMNASSEKTLAPGAGLAISSTTGVVGLGSFKWTAACDIDYGS